MRLKGRVHKLALDGINTDYIISGRYKFHIQNPKELARHIFEDLDPAFARRVKKGDLLVVGKNFGCGSSREQAPLALKASGIKAVIAKSFARIFYRNSFNIGLLLLEADTTVIKDRDRLEIDLKKGILRNIAQNREIPIKAIPDFMKKIVKSKGVLNYVKKHGGFKF